MGNKGLNAIQFCNFAQHYCASCFNFRYSQALRSHTNTCSIFPPANTHRTLSAVLPITAKLRHRALFAFFIMSLLPTVASSANTLPFAPSTKLLKSISLHSKRCIVY